MVVNGSERGASDRGRARTRERVHRLLVRFASLLVLAPLAGACGGERPAPLVVDDAGADVEPMEVCVFDTDLPDVPPSLWIAPRAPLVLVDPGRSTPLTATLTFAF